MSRVDQMTSHIVELDYYQIITPKDPIKPEISLKFRPGNPKVVYSDGEATVVKNSTSHCGLLGNKGWSAGTHKWNIIINSIFNSNWLKRTSFSHTCVNIPKEKMFPFVDIYAQGISVSIRSEYT